MAGTIDTANRFFVGRGSADINITNTAMLMRPLSTEDALNLAAWLVAVTGKEDRFQAILKAVLAT